MSLFTNCMYAKLRYYFIFDITCLKKAYDFPPHRTYDKPYKYNNKAHKEANLPPFCQWDIACPKQNRSRPARIMCDGHIKVTEKSE